MPQDTFNPSESGRNSVELMYDPVTRQWVPRTVNNAMSEGNVESPEPNAPSSSEGSDSQATAEREYIEIEMNTLTGELVLVPSPTSMRIKVNDTLRIEGLGKYLSGKYFVSGVRRSLHKDGGYSNSFTLLKTGFGDSLKSSDIVDTPRSTEIPKFPL